MTTHCGLLLWLIKLIFGFVRHQPTTVCQAHVQQAACTSQVIEEDRDRHELERQHDKFNLISHMMLIRICLWNFLVYDFI